MGGRWIDEVLKLFFIKYFKATLPHLPKKVLYFVAELSAMITYCLDSSKRQVMREETKKFLDNIIFGEKLNYIIRRSISNQRKDIFEAWMIPACKKEDLKKLYYLVGKEHIDAALAKGKGLIIIQTHFGFRKLILLALGYEGYTINQLAAKPTSWKVNREGMEAHNKVMDAEVEFEKALPAKFIYVEDSLRSVFTALKNNEIVVIALDGLVGSKRHNVKFLNRTAKFSPTPISLSVKTGAVVLPAFVVRKHDNRHEIIIEEPLMTDAHGYEHVVQQFMENYCRILEQYVLKFPCHYIDWFYRSRIWPVKDSLHIFQ